jgi:hypothetical protein
MELQAGSSHSSELSVPALISTSSAEFSISRALTVNNAFQMLVESVFLWI